MIMCGLGYFDNLGFFFNLIRDYISVCTAKAVLEITQALINMLVSKLYNVHINNG